MVHSGNSGVGQPSEACREWCSRVIHDSVEVGVVGQPEASHPLVSTVHDEIRAIRKGDHRGNDTPGRHAVDRPIRAGHFRLDRNTVVQGKTLIRRRASTDQNLERVGVRRFLRHDHERPFERIRATSEEVVDSAGNVGQRANRLESVLVQDPRLVVVGDEDVPAREDSQERVEIVGVRPLQPFHEQQISTRGSRNDFEIGYGSTVASVFAAHNQERAIDHLHGRWVPATDLQRDLIDVLLPVIVALDAWCTVGCEKANAVKRVSRPSADVDLSCGLVRESQAGRTEHVGFQALHFSPRLAVVVDCGQIQLERAR